MLNIDRLVRLYNDYIEEYRGSDFVAVNTTGVHVGAEALLETFALNQIKIIPRNSEEYPWVLSVDFEGVNFFALPSPEFMEKVWPPPIS